VPGLAEITEHDELLLDRLCHRIMRRGTADYSRAEQALRAYFDSLDMQEILMTMSRSHDVVGMFGSTRRRGT
jgi:hypothetical protein